MMRAERTGSGPVQEKKERLFIMKNWKKTGALLLAALMTASMLASCEKKTDDSKKEDTSDQSSDSSEDSSDTALTAMEQDALSLVTLGDYKGIKVNPPSADNPSEEDLATYCNTNLLTGEDSLSRDDSKNTVGENDIVNIDYQGLKDGVAFDGGTASDVYIDVAGNKDAVQGTGYIDGFTSGLVGATVGSTVDSHVTFPDNYGATDLAGKEVIFRFTVNYICTKMTYDTLTDAFVKDKFGSASVSDFKENYLKQQYTSYVNANEDALLKKAVLDAITENATVDSSVSEQDKQEYILLAIAAKENISVDEEGYDSYVQSMMSQFSVSDEDTFFTNVGGEDVVKNYYLASKALAWAADNAVTE